jgi:hypothetical protein
MRTKLSRRVSTVVSVVLNVGAASAAGVILAASLTPLMA